MKETRAILLGRLIDANPAWIGGENPPFYGIEFDCPMHDGCGRVAALFRNPIGAPIRKREPRWERTGETFGTLTVHPSIRVVAAEATDCQWHGWIEDGKIRTEADSK